MNVSEVVHPQQDEEVSDLVLYAEEIEYFETHDLSEELANSPEVHFEVSPQARSHFYYEIEPELQAKLRRITKQRGISAETLLNEWVREKAAEIEAVGAAR